MKYPASVAVYISATSHGTPYHGGASRPWRGIFYMHRHREKMTTITEQLKGPFQRIDGVLYRIASFAFRAEHRRRSGHQFLVFGMIGVVNTAIDFAVYTYLTRTTEIFNYHTNGKYLANVISFAVATTFSYFSNRSWTFRRKRRPSAGEAARFYAATLAGLAVNTGALFLFVTYGEANDLLAKLFATACSLVWNFFLNKTWVFPGEAHGKGKMRRSGTRAAVPTATGQAHSPAEAEEWLR